MDRRASNTLTDIIRSLSHAIVALDQVGLEEAASILRIGQLDLQMRLNTISEDELCALCEELERLRALGNSSRSI